MHGVFSPEQMENQNEKWVNSYNSIHVGTDSFRAAQELKMKKEEARSLMRDKYLNSEGRKERAFCTIDTLEERKMEREKKSNEFLLGAAKEGKVPGLLTFSSRIGREALIQTNKYRATFKLPPLAWSDEIHPISLNHSEQMGLGKKGFNHDGFRVRMRSIPFHVRAGGENLFMTSHSRLNEDAIARQAVQGWIHSPGHRKNLVGKFNICGIAAYKSQNGRIYITQILALR